MRRRSGCAANCTPNMSKHSRSIQLAPRYTGTIDGKAVSPAPSRLRSSTAKPASRLSTQATISRPSSFQSIAVRKLKNVQPSESLANRAASSHCPGETCAVIGEAVAATVTPATPASSSRARSAVIISVHLRGGLGALSRATEVRNLILQQQEAIEQRLGGRRTAGHVDVHRHDAIDPLDDMVAVAEGAAGVGARSHRHDPLRIRHL